MSQAQAAQGAPAATHYRWVVVALLFAIIIINYIDRSAISYAIGPMAKELGIGDSQRGLVLGAFGIGYALTTFLGGILVDRFGPRIVLAVSVALWVVSIGGTGLVQGFTLALVARAALGLAEGPMFPGMTGAISRWLSPRERGRAMGSSLTAVPVSLAIGAPVVSSLIAWLGWRGMFFVLGVVSFIWLPLWWLLFRDRPEQSGFVNEAELKEVRRLGEHSDSTADENDDAAPAEANGATSTSWRRLMTNPTLLANYWAFFVFGYFLFFFMTWLPGYLEKVFHLSVSAVGWFSVVPWAAAAVVLFSLGHFSDRLLKRSRRLRPARSYLIAGTQAIAAVAILPVAFSSSLTLSLILITIALAASMGANSAYYAVNVDIAPDRSATALGIMDFGFAIAGFLAPAITGWVVGSQGSFADAFFLLTALAVSSVILTLLFHRPDTHAIGHPYAADRKR
ncbi:MFS transporter [Salinisphaera sp. LB1]|uniref:MFS transporter n=1 Tax=Salinisphaera sp. LB1 TaxID=2183911 RepID=UPI000D706909|nr:MFS transporter [Salinisphaera sp. LB1]AWN17199.1 L-Proline/Glycine betaine transporter ProP [Salinisphaera sp. LB1]